MVNSASMIKHEVDTSNSFKESSDVNENQNLFELLLSRWTFSCFEELLSIKRLKLLRTFHYHDNHRGAGRLPEQPDQQLRTLAEFLFLFGDAGSALASVQPIESRDAVDDEERESRPRRQGSLQKVERENELGGGGAVDHQEPRNTQMQGLLIGISRRRAGRTS